jgi:NAD(P)-dependent dehydrogenase (short-subunit alcohol dehydrogenase family)
MIDPGLNNRIALVTGGNNPFGIGAAIARSLASQGVKVFIHYYRQIADKSDYRIRSQIANEPGIDSCSKMF